MRYVFLFITVLGTVVGQVVLKCGQETLYMPKNFSASEVLKLVWRSAINPYFISAACLALIAALSWTIVIQKMKLSYAYPFMSLSYVLIFIVSYFLFKEPVSVFQVLGVGLIFVGLILFGIK